MRHFAQRVGLFLALSWTVQLPAFAQSKFSISKAITTISDPQNDVKPKAIPGSVVDYTVSVTNPASGASNATSIVYVDTISSGTMLYVLDLGVSGSGPLVFNDGSVLGVGGSRLTYTYSGLSSTTDQLEFSSDSGISWTYIPIPDASGYDGSVTNIRVKPSGSQALGSTFTLRYRVMVR